MAAINNGTYVIVPAHSTGCALDCRGASEGNGANIWIWGRNSRDAQLITVVNNSDGTSRLLFTLSGKSVDVAVVNALADGQNVQQWANSDSGAQKWLIEADGKTVTIGGATYNTYVLKCNSSNYVMDVTGGQTAQGTNIEIWTANGSDWQRWAFIPQNPVAPGTYMIRSAIDTNAVVDVTGGAAGANVQLYGESGSNGQIWIVNEYENGVTVIENAGSGKVLNVYGNQSVAGANVQQWFNDGSSACKWYPEPAGQMMINGATVPTYHIRFMTGSGKVMDATGGQARPQTNIEIWDANGSAAQEWAFQPYSILDTSLPVPSGVQAIFGSQTGNILQIGSGDVGKTGMISICASWVCNWDDYYQIRYRTRERMIKQAIGNWDVWHSVADQTPANQGWGDIGHENAKVVVRGSRKELNGAIRELTIGSSTSDYTEVQIEIRAFKYNDKRNYIYYHGNSVTQLVKLVWKPTLTISGVSWSPDGLKVSYTSDYTRSGCTIIVDSLEIAGHTLDGCEFSGVSSKGSVTIPQSRVGRIPSSGDKVSISMRMRTDMAVSVSASANTTLTFSGTLTVSPTYADGTGYSKIVSFTKSEEDHVYVQTAETCMEFDNDAETSIALPPFGTAYEIIVTSSSGSAWGISRKSFPAMIGTAHVWNWGTRCALITLNADDPPKVTKKYSHDSTEQITTGRKHPVYNFGSTITSSLSVEGVYMDDTDHNTEKDMEALSGAGHAFYRDARGRIYRVAVLDVSTESKGIGWGSVTVEQKEESL